MCLRISDGVMLHRLRTSCVVPCTLSSSISFAVAFAIVRNDKCIHLWPTCVIVDVNSNIWHAMGGTTYFEHDSYKSEAALDGNEIADWGDLIKILCGAVKQVIFRFSPTASSSVARMELKIRVPGDALSKTSVSYGTFNIHQHNHTKKKIGNSKNTDCIQFIIWLLKLNVTCIILNYWQKPEEWWKCVQ